MIIKPKKLYPRIYTPSLITIFLILISLTYRLLITENQCFLFINQFHNTIADYFFSIITNLGDGLIWLPLLIFIYQFRKKRLVLVVTNFLVSTIITLFLKRILFWDELRPISLMEKGFHLHLVEGIRVHSNNSFPSGHTVTVFAIVFTLLTLYKKKLWLKYLLIITAIMVGFSRIYLSQHFPIDVISGALIGIFSTYLSIFILSKISKVKNSVTDDDEHFETIGI